MIKPAILSVLVLLFLGLAAKAYYDTNSIEIKHYQINHSSLAKVLAGLKVAHLSDLHIKSIGLKENKILEILKGEKPDLVFITGDSISFEGPYEPAISFFHQFEAPLGVYAVMGNTESTAFPPDPNSAITLTSIRLNRSLEDS